MKGTHNPNQLVVEGQDDLFTIVGLMRAHVDWPEGPGSVIHAPVFIHSGNGTSEILNADFLGVFFKNPVLKIAGLVLDADTVPRGRYQSIRSLCIGLFPNLPREIPPEGLVVENDDKKRFGAWIMPDNASDGSIETFLRWLVPAPREATWDHAEKSVQIARGLGCPCSDKDVDRANLYTWLAWQDPLAESPGVALSQRVLNPDSQSATSFVSWFIKLYQLPPKSKLFS